MDTSDSCDILVIGGGINGAGVARDAAGRGSSVILCEKDDLAQGTSSRSSKLVHGGLRYLETYEFGLVRKALAEREVLLRIAPHIVHPARFVLPHDPSMRPAWMIRAGLFLYDHLASRVSLPGSRYVNFSSDPSVIPLSDRYTSGFEYSDCRVDDSRLVVLNAVDAARHGAQVLTRTRVSGARRDNNHWLVNLTTDDGGSKTVAARAIVNAAGPHVSNVLEGIPDAEKTRKLRLVKGSHVVFRKLYDGDQCYIIQNGDGRIVFFIPYENDYTMVGTTDIVYSGDPDQVAIDEEETEYLVELVNQALKKPVSRDDIIWAFSGVRPLVDDDSDNASKVTRDYLLEMDTGSDSGKSAPPLLSVYGGKITTYRVLAEKATNMLGDVMTMPGRAWTSTGTLPGGDLPNGGLPELDRLVASQYPWLPDDVRSRYITAYGSRVNEVIGKATGIQHMGHEIVPGLYEREIAWLRNEEWAKTSEDILFRRTKLGIRNSLWVDALDNQLAA